MNGYDVGDGVPLVYTINAAATVVLTVTDPEGTTSTPATTETGTAPAVIYTATVAVDKPGTWLYRFAATGAVVDAEAGQFFVRATADDRVYTTVAEVKRSLNIPPTDTQDDADIAAAILACSRGIDSHCERHFWQVAETRTFTPRNLWSVKLGAYSDLVSVTTLKTDTSGDGTYEITWQTSDFQLLGEGGSPNVNAAPEPRPYTQVRAVGAQTFPAWCGPMLRRRDLVQIDGTWGWPAVPTGVREACKLLAVELFKLREAPFGSTGIGDLGIVRVGQNRKATMLLAPYRLYPVLAA